MSAAVSTGFFLRKRPAFRQATRGPQTLCASACEDSAPELCSRPILSILYATRVRSRVTTNAKGTEMATTSGAAELRPIASEGTRWGQLIFGIICMVMIANLQYGWTLFVNPIDQKYHWGRAAIQVAFTIFVLTETWLVPVEGYLVDRFGPKVMVCGSGVLVAIAWVINSVASSLTLLYIGAAIGGIGAGVIYGARVGNALKWFPDRRGLAAGLTAAGFGAGSAPARVP